MSNFLRVIASGEVNDPVTFAAYSQQTIGTKSPNAKEMVVLRSRLKEFFSSNPRADWATLVRTVQYVRSQRRRLALPWAVIDQVHWAYKDGFLPELDPANHVLTDPRVDGQVEWILEHETDEEWQRMFRFASDVPARRELLRLYREQAHV